MSCDCKVSDNINLNCVDENKLNKKQLKMEKKNTGLLAAALAGLSLNMAPKGKNITPPTQLTKKQRKSRAKAKVARKSRKINRKKK